MSDADGALNGNNNTVLSGNNNIYEITNNNSSGDLVIIMDKYNDVIKGLQDENKQLHAGMAWAEQQLKIKDALINELLKRLKKS